MSIDRVNVAARSPRLVADGKLLLILVKSSAASVLNHVGAKRQPVVFALADRRLYTWVADHASHTQLAIGTLPRCLASTYPVAVVVLEEQRHASAPPEVCQRQLSRAQVGNIWIGHSRRWVRGAAECEDHG